MKNKIHLIIICLLFCVGLVSCNYFKSPFEKWYYSIKQLSEVDNKLFKVQILKIDLSKSDSSEIGFKIRIAPISKSESQDQNMFFLNNENFSMEYKKSIIKPEYTQYVSSGIKSNYEYLILFNKKDLAFKNGLQFKVDIPSELPQNLTIPIN